MHLQSISISNFRNYERADITFSRHFNLIYGLNAHGKTNFLEAIYILCLGRSFRMAKNQNMLRFDSPHFIIEGNLILDNQIQKTVVLRYIRDGLKEISIDHKRIRSHSTIFGHFPAVVMSPDEFRITAGGPAERRRFIDILLSQVSVSYLSNLQEYNRILKQRNRILQNIRNGQTFDKNAIIPWNNSLVRKGSQIIGDRYSYLREFDTVLEPIYRQYTQSNENLTVTLDSPFKDDTTEAIEAQFSTALAQVQRREEILGTTLRGPHRDDLRFSIDDVDLRHFGSRGEHKSALISLKIAEFFFVQERRQETPIMLLDDCYSELDGFREKRVFESLKDLGQVFMTSPRQHQAAMSQEFSNSKAFHVENGVIEPWQ